MILCCGESLIDMLPRSSGEGDVLLPVAGGAIFNTAIALGRLGAPVGMLTGLSSDMFGLQLGDALQSSHVDASHVIRSNRPTTLQYTNNAELLLLLLLPPTATAV